jgi:NTE family protein
MRRMFRHQQSFAGALRLCAVTLLAGSVGMAGIASAQEAPLPQRPRVGLVLAGGGAKGGAHVGVLKVLEELRIPIDCIAGTSMGALVGAGYASGIPAQELADFLGSVDWQSVIGSAGVRELMPIEQKRGGVTYSNELEFGIQGGRVIAPSGVIGTSRIENLLRSYVARARLQGGFERLPIPFRAIATDMVNGDMVVLGSGDLATAMRASMAIPGAFSPVVQDGKVLADGGMTRNLPIDVARELCADIVIVSNLQEPDFKPEDLQSAVSLLSRTTDIMIIANERQQLATLTDRDVLINVPTGDIGSAAFERVPETFPIGEAAARSAAAALARLSVPEDEFVAWRKRVTAGQGVEVRLAAVRYEGLEWVNPEYLAVHSQVHAGDVVDVNRLSAEALRMGAMQELSAVGYRFEGDPDNPTLVWLPEEKAWGPAYLQFDIGMYTSSGGDLAFVIYARHTSTWLNSLGGQWRNEVQLGFGNRIATSFYQPLDVGHHWFVEPRVMVQQSLEDFYSGGERLSRYSYADGGGGVDFGRNFGSLLQVQAGYTWLRRSVRRDTGILLLPESTRTETLLNFNATLDSRDSRFSPTRGVASVLEYTRSDRSLGSELDWERLELGVGAAIPIGSDVIWTTAAAGTDLGSDLPFDRQYTLGGTASFPGFELDELRGNEYWTVSGSYLYKLADLFRLRGDSLYLGLRLQAGRIFGPGDPTDDDVLYGASLSLNGRTPAGPMALGAGYTSLNSWSFWIAVGRPIGQGTVLERGVFR